GDGVSPEWGALSAASGIRDPGSTRPYSASQGPSPVHRIPDACLPLLITGITGVAGYNALHYFQKRYPGQVIGIRPRQTWQLKGVGLIALDAEDPHGMQDLFGTYRFASVLNCTGNCALKSCELDPTMARQLNVDSAANVVANTRAQGSRL